MKKLVFAFAAVVAMTFASCGGNTQNTEVVDSDSIVEEVVDTPVVSDSDSVAVADSASVDTAALQ